MSEKLITMIAPKLIAVSFVDAINAKDLNAMMHIMGEEHIFVDSLGNFFEGCSELKLAWRRMFRNFPNYQLRVERIIEDGDTIVLMGCSSGSARSTGDYDWHVPTVWVATVDGYNVKEWRMYADNTALACASNRAN